ncbi:MAG TPA: LysR family transcriptional regulator [Xanthobacteraceae bacterium]
MKTSLRIETLDLNLLRVFNVLMEERSVSKAAARMHLTQSAVSNALKRLRAHLADPVLVREGNSMVPSPTASHAWPEMRAALANIQDGLERFRRFDPGRLRDAVRIGLDDYCFKLHGAGIHQHIRKSAPQAPIEFHDAPPKEAGALLAENRIDIAVGPFWGREADLQWAHLATENFAVVVCSSHPMATGASYLDDYLERPHLLISPRGITGGNVDAALAQIGRTRRIGATCPYFLQAPELLPGTELVLNYPAALARALKTDARLRIARAPIEIPGFDIVAAWHKRASGTAYIRWLHGSIAAVVRSKPRDRPRRSGKPRRTRK